MAQPHYKPCLWLASLRGASLSLSCSHSLSLFLSPLASTQSLLTLTDTLHFVLFHSHLFSVILSLSLVFLSLVCCTLFTHSLSLSLCIIVAFHIDCLWQWARPLKELSSFCLCLLLSFLSLCILSRDESACLPTGNSIVDYHSVFAQLSSGFCCLWHIIIKGLNNCLYYCRCLDVASVEQSWARERHGERRENEVFISTRDSLSMLLNDVSSLISTPSPDK